MKKITLLLLFMSLNCFSQFNYFIGNINLNANSSSPREFISFNGNIYFNATFRKTSNNSSIYFDQELGFFNPENQNFGEFANINTIDDSSGSSEPRDFFEFNGFLYFTAFSGPSSTDRELYRTNGTTVELFKDLIPGSGSGFLPGDKPLFTIMNNKLYFVARTNDLNGNNYIWQSDGTAVNTLPVSNVIVSTFQNQNTIIKVFNNELYFTGTENLGVELYKFNDITNSTSLLKDLFPGTNSSNPRDLVVFNNQLFFAAQTPSFNNKVHIIKSDGTTAGTQEVLDNINFSNNPNSLTVLNNQLLYVAFNPNTNLVDLYKCQLNTSTSSYAISLVKQFSQGIAPALNIVTKLTLFNNEVYFIARQSTDYGNGGIGQVYKTNGTTSGTIKAVSINATQIGSAAQLYLPADLFTFNNKICLSINSFTAANEQLWITDGTDNYFEKITNTGNSGAPTSFVTYTTYASGNKLYFAGGTTATGEEFCQITDNSTLSTSHYQLKNLKVYPNPTSGIINIQSENLSEFTIEIYDLIGKKVAQFKNQNQIDITNYTSGIYLLKIIDNQTNDTSTQKKIIKQ